MHTSMIYYFVNLRVLVTEVNSKKGFIRGKGPISCRLINVDYNIK